jgi:hypothetical protein
MHPQSSTGPHGPKANIVVLYILDPADKPDGRNDREYKAEIFPAVPPTKVKESSVIAVTMMRMRLFNMDANYPRYFFRKKESVVIMIMP